MKLAYCTNIWNHHQGPVCTELAKLLGPDNFKLLLHQPLDHKYSLERINMGWNLNPPDEPWIVGPPKTCADVDYSEYVKIAMEADAIVANSELPYLTWEMLTARHCAGKLNFRMGERIYKGGRSWWYPFSPKKWLGRLILRNRFESAGLHFLTMSHWCADDLKYLYACKGRTWRWGYLTSVSEKYIEKVKRDKVCIGWCGRMIDWKHVDYIIRAVALLPPELKSSIDVRLVGDGDQKQFLKGLAQECGVDGIVHFRRSVSSVEALEFMRDLDIYVFPGNSREGWGAALLEAMDKGCVVIANMSAGATLEVVEDGVNGFVFKDGDVANLSARIAWLIEHGQERNDIGYHAWETIQSWSPQEGARRLIELIDGVHSGRINENRKSGLCAMVR